MSPDRKRWGAFPATVAVTASDLRKVARVSKSNGTDGEVLLSFTDFLPQDIDLREPVFIFFDGLPVPFFVFSHAQRGSRFFVRLNDVLSLSDAEELVGRDVFVRSDSLAEADADTGGELSVESLIGWSIEDTTSGLAGEVVDYEDIPGNPCLYVKVAGQPSPIMVPLHGDFMADVDTAHRILRANLPAGLVCL